jgi:uncharacterized glyoxalase superfamily metalloenzyme YdcJ
MTSNTAISDDLRAAFAAALSDMYRKEVPQYGTLLELVSNINQSVINGGEQRHDSRDRIDVERHGAIRLGSTSELATIRRLFAIMGMEPVGYYDLSIAGLPIHATGFRPTSPESLQRNPFRVFTSLLRLELIEDPKLREQARDILAKRRIFSPRCLELIRQFEAQGTFSREAAQEFLSESLEIFRWHKVSTVDIATYKALESTHPLIADIACFKGPHINHLTPRVLDIDAAQSAMASHGLQAKAVIEGPPPRKHLILLRQTSFLALEEEIAFSNGVEKGGKHRARFGEIEQRGMALTRKGRLLYDEIFASFLSKQAAPGTSQISPEDVLAESFAAFPDDLDTLRREQLAYFRYIIREPGLIKSGLNNFEELVSSGVVSVEPITYEDFLPASAAGIFHSNLNGGSCLANDVLSDQSSFEEALGCQVHNAFELYDGLEKASIQQCLEILEKTQ